MNKRIKGLFAAATAIAISSLSTSGIVTDSGTEEARNIVSAASDSNEVENELIKFIGSGVHDGYYYKCTGCSEDDEMELISPSLFKAKWDSTDKEYCRAPVFERGIEFEPGKDYNWIMESSIEYEMEFSAEGSCFIGTHASFIGKETEEYYSATDMYIIDATVNWELPEDAFYVNDARYNGNNYDIYHIEQTMIGTGKGIKNDIFYIINRNAKSNGKNGKVSFSHELAPFMFRIWSLSGLESVSLGAGINGGVSKGSAEMIRNDITVPEKPRFSDCYEHMENRIYLNNDDHWDSAAQQWADNKKYTAFGYDIEMKGYVGDPVKCTWKYYKDTSEDYSYPQFKRASFDVWKSYSSYSIIDHQGSLSFDDVDDLTLEYNIDIGTITKNTPDSNWYIGADIQCMRDSLASSATSSSDLFGNDPVSYILIYDKFENCNFLTDYDDYYYYAPVEMGTINSNGVEYNVLFKKAKNNSAYSGIYVIRKDELEPVNSDNIPAGYTRYENSYSITDILSKLKEIGLDPGGISEAEFTFTANETSGTAYINHADIKRTIPEWKTFSAEDIQLMQDYILGKGNESPNCDDYIYHNYLQMDLYEYLIRMQKYYDLNGDGIWDIYDLCEMRNRIGSINHMTYVKPDELIKYGSSLTVQADDLKLYTGPDESYEMITSIPKNSRLKELGTQSNNDEWFFTEYNGNYGWAKTFQDDNTTLTGLYENMNFKPVIYLYPEQETDVHVELELTESDLYTTYPKYNNGWDVTAYPDGTLLNKADGTHHKYLFWDSSNCRTRYDFSKGFCVAGGDTESFLKEKLTYMGLTEDEMNEFIVYWLPLMEHNKYNLISFQSDVYTDSAKLNITPTPDSLLRVFMAYVPLEEAADIEPQQLSTFERNGFTVVEWGGSKIQ